MVCPDGNEKLSVPSGRGFRTILLSDCCKINPAVYDFKNCIAGFLCQTVCWVSVQIKHELNAAAGSNNCKMSPEVRTAWFCANEFDMVPMSSNKSIVFFIIKK